MVSFTPWPLYSRGKSPQYPLDMRFDGPQNLSGRGGEEKESLPCREVHLICPGCLLVSIWSFDVKIKLLNVIKYLHGAELFLNT